jgi:hypothetical protein
MSLSTFYRHVSDKKKFKRRRERLKPLLTPAHQAARLAFVQAMLRMTEEARRRITFVDEKQFLTFVAGKLILPVDDTTPHQICALEDSPSECNGIRSINRAPIWL